MNIINGKQKTSRRRRAAVALAASGLVISLSGCGDSTEALPMAVEIIGDDYSFDGVPEELAAGATITLRNDSDVELHEIVAVRLPDDEKRSGAELLRLPAGRGR